MRTTFGERLFSSVTDRGPLCVGIDPHPSLLDAWRLPDTVDGLRKFAAVVVEALAGQVAVLKPQSAFFERHGSKGISVLEEVVAGSRELGALTIVDVKRGDIGSTMQAYADAYVGDGSPLAGDAVTVSPYLGFGSLCPLLELAATNSRGVFVLALTSNPEGATVQRATDANGRSVAQGIIDEVGLWNAAQGGLHGSVGVVVGATVGTEGGAALDLGKVNGPVLAPGIGAQGATGADLRSVFGSSIYQVLPSTSRAVLRAGPTVAGLREAAKRSLEDCESALQLAAQRN